MIITNVNDNLLFVTGYQNLEEVELKNLLESGGLQSQIAQQKAAQKTNEEAVDSDASTYSSQQKFKQINGEKMDYDTEDFRSFKNNHMPGPAYFNSMIDAMPPAPPLPPQLMAK